MSPALPQWDSKWQGTKQTLLQKIYFLEGLRSKDETGEGGDPGTFEGSVCGQQAGEHFRCPWRVDDPGLKTLSLCPAKSFPMPWSWANPPLSCTRFPRKGKSLFPLPGESIVTKEGQISPKSQFLAWLQPPENTTHPRLFHLTVHTLPGPEKSHLVPLLHSS